MECGKPVISGQFLCADCTARKAQPKTQASAVQPVNNPPTTPKASWVVRIVGGLGVAYLCWLGFSAVLVNKASSPADTVPNFRGNTQPPPATLDSIVRPELNQSDRDIDTLIGAWRYQVASFERQYGSYDPWNENGAVKDMRSGVPFFNLLNLIRNSERTIKAIQDLSRTATAYGQTNAPRYQQEIRDKFPLYLTESKPLNLPNPPNNPNDYLPTNTRDYGDLLK